VEACGLEGGRLISGLERKYLLNVGKRFLKASLQPVRY
jgi:hypothetical protein